MKYLTILFLFATTISINAQDIVVNSSGLPGTYSTISAAVQAANSGDKILVSNQAFPYLEDTLFIDKGVTILPYSDITHIDFEGQIQITLDSISDLTLIGFDSPDTDITSVFNDTTRNSLSTVNIVDCHFSHITLDQPKTSLYLSYSTAKYVYFSHGDIIGNDLDGIQVGIHDFSNITYNRDYFVTNADNNTGQNALYHPSACQVFTNSVDFGNVSVRSDTINVIANNFYQSYIAILNRDFPVHVYNNSDIQLKLYLICPPSKGINRFINNNLFSNGSPIKFMLVYCSSYTPSHNLEHINLHISNNSNNGNYYGVEFDSPSNNESQYNENNFPVSSAGIMTYNTWESSYYFQGFDWYNQNNYYTTSTTNPSNTALLLLGPRASGSNPNPSAEYLDLDLTPNTPGINGGSHAFDNYNPSGAAGFGTMTGSKARITYLNLPTQIFDPNNIQIKAKAVHGN
tara:strand:+ start:3354 stop:4727 length:1374 start_codon:yes stop_codon:yes gene_type:complete